MIMLSSHNIFKDITAELQQKKLVLSAPNFFEWFGMIHKALVLQNTGCALFSFLDTTSSKL